MNNLGFWLGSGVFILRILVMGYVWTVTDTDERQTGRVYAVLRRCMHLFYYGLAVNLLLILILSVFMLWSPWLDWFCFVLLTAFGFWRHHKLIYSRVNPNSLIRDGLAMMLIVCSFLAALILPGRSEWLAGGWDPGLYQNNSVAISRRGGIADFKDSLYTDLSPTERVVLSRGNDQYREIMPGVPINIENGHLPLYFFHLSSLFGAWLFRSGGFSLLVRQPMILGWLLLVPSAALLRFLTGSKACALTALLVMLTSPFWWYHQAIPTSELLQLLIFSGAVFLYLDNLGQKSWRPVICGLLLFLGCLNRMDFALFAAFFLVLGAIAGSLRYPSAKSIWFKCTGIFLLCLWGGVFFNVIFAGETVKLLQQKDNVLFIVVGGLAILTLASIAGPILIQRLINADLIYMTIRITGLLAVLGYLALTAISFHDSTVQHWFRIVEPFNLLYGASSRYLSTIAFWGRFPMLAAWSGAVLLFVNTSTKNRQMLVWGWGLIVVVSMLFTVGQIADIYPWGLRRYLPFFLPAIMFFATVPFRLSLDRQDFHWRYILRISGLVLVSVMLYGGLCRSSSAAKVSDYKGMSALLENDLIPLFASEDVVVADAPIWGIPLLLAGGVDVINGKLLWRSKDENHQRMFVDALMRIEREEGRRVLWLTSTGKGIKLYQFNGTPPSLLTASPIIYEYATVIHSQRADHFATRDHRAEFRIYTGVPVLLEGHVGIESDKISLTPK